MTNTLRITPQGERAVGLAFLTGTSIGDIATYHACSTRAIEAVLRAQMQHLIEAKRPESLTTSTEHAHTEPAPA